MTNLAPKDQIIIRLDVTKPVRAEQSLAMLHALLEQLRSLPGIGADAEIEIIGTGRGTWWVQILIIGGAIEAAVTAGNELISDIKEGRTPFSRELAKTIAEYDGDSCTIVSSEVEVTITRSQMPAMALVRESPVAPPTGYAYLTDDGKFLKEGDAYLIDRIPSRPTSPHGAATLTQFRGQFENLGDSAGPWVFESDSGLRMSVDDSRLRERGISIHSGQSYQVEGSVSIHTDGPDEVILLIEDIKPLHSAGPDSRSDVNVDARQTYQTLEGWRASGREFPWYSAATVYHSTQLEGGPPRKRAVAQGGNANVVIAMAMSGNYGSIDDLEIEIEYGSLILHGREIAMAAALPGRPGTGAEGPRQR